MLLRCYFREQDQLTTVKLTCVFSRVTDFNNVSNCAEIWKDTHICNQKFQYQLISHQILP